MDNILKNNIDQLIFFIEKFEENVQNNSFKKLTMSNPKLKSSELKKITVIPVQIKNQIKFSFIYTYNTKDITKNYNFNESCRLIEDFITKEFLITDLYTVNENIRLLSNKKFTRKKIIITEHLLSDAPIYAHDKIKRREIIPNNNQWLHALEISDIKGNILKDKNDKFRQINKYVEIMGSLLSEAGLKNNINIVDMGSGKGYLTFALFDYLKNNVLADPVVTGIEIRKDLVDKCNEISKQCSFEKLSFVNNYIIDSNISNIDVLIALHACDTATDDAIIKAIETKAKLLVVAPCCHKQIRKEMNVVNVLSNITKYGILKERQAELITDTIRALVLELYGYKTKVFEFISSEHTPKNIMISGIKHNNPVKKNKIRFQINDLKKMFGIENHYLEKIFNILPYESR